MKRILLGVALALLVCSCSTFRTSTTTTMNVKSTLNSATTAELQVSEKKISYTFYPKKQDRRAGLNHVINNAVAAALKENGNADILVERQYEAIYKSRLFRKKMKSVTVTGYPATYKNFKIETK